MADEGRISYDDAHMAAVAGVFEDIGSQARAWQSRLSGQPGTFSAIASGPAGWPVVKDHGTAWQAVLAAITTRLGTLDKDAEGIRVAMQSLQYLTAENETLTSLTAGQWASGTQAV